MVVPTAVYSVKFIEREKWLVAGDDDGDIYVYSYGTRKQVTSFRGHPSRIESLAVHPNRPFILSSSAHLIELWNWENDWECTHTFKEHSDRVTQITFNPVDTNIFASASLDHTVKVLLYSLFLF
jgi:coatomer subunit beta'